MSRDLRDEIGHALTDVALQQAVPRATRLATALRRQAWAEYPDHEAARGRARRIKEQAIERLPHLVERFEQAVVRAGGTVHRAVNAEQACAICIEIAQREGVQRIVKSKSMTSEEVGLNAALEAEGLHVRETDLGEYIVQLDGDRPSHIIAPIIHKDLQQVRAVFARAFGMAEAPETPAELTQLARRRLRREFLAAEMGVTGANFLIADTGTVVLVENEGNARMCTQLPRVHVVVAGIEKILPSLADLEPFLQLLPRSATGQLLTAYLSFITGPGWSGSPYARGARALHVVLLDNGRASMRDDPLLREALYCVRCGACLNVCPPYQAVGGHVFGGPTYASGIGLAWEAGVRGTGVAAEFAALCNTCSRCREACPVKIDIPWLATGVKARVRAAGGAAAVDPRRLYALARRARPLRPLVALPPVRALLQRLWEIDVRRPLPAVAAVPLSQAHASAGGRVVRAGTAEGGATPMPARARADVAAPGEAATGSVVLVADCHTDNVEVDAGRAAVALLEGLGYEVVVAAGACCGRAALSQGELGAARAQARELAGLLAAWVEAGVPVVGVEPSCVCCWRLESARLLEGEEPAGAVAAASEEIFAFLRRHEELLRARLRPLSGGRRRIVVHGHCQQRTAGWFGDALAVLSWLPGVELVPTAAECCGMAGSFGYRPLTYEVSVELGQRWLAEIETLGAPAGSEAFEVAVFGTSCRAQLRDLGGTAGVHPLCLLAEALAP